MAEESMGAPSFADLRERVSKVAVPVVKALNEDATSDQQRELGRAAGHAIWTFGMVLVGVYQELNEIKHELRRAHDG